MDDRSLRVLEYYKVRDMLEQCASCELGRERIRQLAPITNLAMIEEAQRGTSEARSLLDMGKQIPFGGVRDVRSSVERADRGATLSCDELLDILSTLSASRSLKKILGSLGPEYPVLADAAADIGTFGDLEQAISRAISESGEVMDSASSALRSIRSKIRSLNAKVRDNLDSMVRSPQWSRLLQDPIVSIRNGRFVVPVRAEMRSQVPGIVHDQSASGATVFVEPMPVVELNNELRQAISQEEAEVERVLSELSAKVGSQCEQLRLTLDAIGNIDFIMAKGRLSQRMGASVPQLNDMGHINLIAARHPLLKGDVVPIDAYLGQTFTTLVITGPNTGGKTVTLKTIGLITLMAQSGLHIPAEPGSDVAVFSKVFADIGDEQSIEQSLSTFSSHMTHIVAIMSMVDHDSLVLLDELGAGTDPQEGAALAMAILETLHLTGARTVATTHYSELKIFAHTTEGLSNASVEFDVETLCPTYRLSIGVPGASNAFAIAERLGLPEEVLDRARSLVGTGGQRMELMITNLKEECDRAETAREDAEKLRSRYLRLKDEYEEQTRRLRSERSEIMRAARAEAESIIQEARKESERIIGRLRAIQAQQELVAKRLVEEEVITEDSLPRSAVCGEASLPDEAIRAARRDLEALREITRELTAVAPESDREVTTIADVHDDGWSSRIEQGDDVEVVALGQKGVVLDQLGPDEYMIGIGPMRVNVNRGSIRKLRSSQAEEPDRGYGRRGTMREPGSVSFETQKAATIGAELDLRGMRVEEALFAVDKYLDDAVLAGIQKARIIHGKGTGALRDAVTEQLGSDPRVASFRFGLAGEGGDGVTVVSFGTPGA
ncbi:MAG: endonuclease MutS2 [Bacillota bacterium]|jgi:DNA mismatch repair protein MutS2